MPKPILFGMSWLGWFNFVVLQWFCVRLVWCGDRAPDGSVYFTGWRWIVGVVPLTGWWSDYRYLPGGHQ